MAKSQLHFSKLVPAISYTEMTCNQAASLQQLSYLVTRIVNSMGDGKVADVRLAWKPIPLQDALHCIPDIASLVSRHGWRCISRHAIPTCWQANSNHTRPMKDR